MSKDELDPRMEMGGDVVTLERRAVLRDEIGSVLSPWGEYDVADALAVLMDARCARDVPKMCPRCRQISRGSAKTLATQEGGGVRPAACREGGRCR